MNKENNKGWCSMHGLMKRKAGMYNQESRKMKICQGVAFGLGAVIMFAIGGIFCERASNSAAINHDFEPDLMRAQAAFILEGALSICDWRRVLESESQQSRALAAWDIPSSADFAAGADLANAASAQGLAAAGAASAGGLAAAGAASAGGLAAAGDLAAAGAAAGVAAGAAGLAAGADLAAAGAGFAAGAAGFAAGAVGGGFGFLASIPGAQKLPEFDYPYDGCNLPIFETYGINNPCPDAADVIAAASTAIEDGIEQVAIGTSLLALGTTLIAECGVDAECYSFGTGWSFIHAFNGSLCIIMGFNFILMTLGAVYWWPRFIGCTINLCLVVPHIVCIIFMFQGASSTYGQICGFNRSTSTYKGDYKWNFAGATYEDDRNLITACAIVQIPFVLWQTCCCWIPAYKTPQTDIVTPNKSIEQDSERAGIEVGATGQPQQNQMFYK